MGSEKIYHVSQEIEGSMTAFQFWIAIHNYESNSTHKFGVNVHRICVVTQIIQEFCYKTKRQLCCL